MDGSPTATAKPRLAKQGAAREAATWKRRARAASIIVMVLLDSWFASVVLVVAGEDVLLLDRSIQAPGCEHWLNMLAPSSTTNNELCFGVSKTGAEGKIEVNPVYSTYST